MPHIARLHRERIWVLTGERSSRVLHLDSDDLLHGVYWGPRLDLDQAAALLELPEFAGPGLAERADGGLDLAAAGGLRYGHAGLQVVFADGTRDLELEFLGEEAEQDDLVLHFADRHYPLAVEVRYRLYPGCDVIERSLLLHHTGADGGEPISVLRADSATWALPRLPGPDGLPAYRLSQVRGAWAAEYRLHRGELPYGETVVAGRRGFTGAQSNPWAMIDDGTATEEYGAVYSCALAWSGSWRLTAQRMQSELVAVSAGLDHGPGALVLTPGETLETPVSAGLFTEGGFGAASRAWHEYVVDHVLPYPVEPRPVLYNSWEATTFDVSLDGQRALADRAASIGAETFVMDDGWFGARVDERAGLGDWRPNPDRFPDGLTPLVEHVHGLGLKFGLWVEPEMVNPDSDLYRAHPDWVVHQPNRRRTEQRSQLVLNLARPEVAGWVHGAIDRLLRRDAIDFLKWDMNRPLSEIGAGAGAHPDRLLIDYTRNLYAMLDRLRADHPDLRIESCASGGGRVDLGILARTDQVWTSDNTDAVDRLAIQHGFSQLYPATVMYAWVTDSPNPYTGRTVPLEFRFHAAMSGALGLGGDLEEWSKADLALAARLVAEYKEIRPLIHRGLQYRLGRPEDYLSAVQYVAQDGSHAAVLSYRRARAFGRTEAPIRLRGLDPAGRYQDAAADRVYPGALLLAVGLPLELAAGDYASALIQLRRID
ncbi:MAG TPA: alpha-galactosidase [Actinocrinis sp.]